MSLREKRKQIEEIDKKILELLAKRQKITTEIAKIKQKNNLPIKDEEREQKLINKITDQAAEKSLNPQPIKQIYQKIHQMSREKQHSQMGEGNLP